jgi:pimeloyl-ACP methyl ester carboxylesterase
MEQHFISWQDTTISYLKAGKGKKIVLCLHGFGEEAATFSFLEKHLADDFTIYAIDLPWHGKTDWNKQLIFPVSDLIVLLTNMISDYEHQKLHLLCYSMGGRIGLSLLQHIPHKIEKAVLLASDGLQMNGWYWLATQTSIGNRFFRFTMNHPTWFGTMTDLLNQRKWINSSVAKYIHHYIDHQQVRDDLYRIWTTMRKFRPKLNHIKSNLKQHHVPVHLVFGEYDRIILAKYGYRFQKGAANLIHVHVVSSGHQLLREKHAMLIISLLSAE